MIPIAFDPVGYIVRDESRRREDELESFNFFELGLESLKGVDREAGRRDLQLYPRRYGLFEVVPVPVQLEVEKAFLD